MQVLLLSVVSSPWSNIKQVAFSFGTWRYFQEINGGGRGAGSGWESSRGIDFNSRYRWRQITQNESYLTDWDLLDNCGLQLSENAEGLETVQNGQWWHSRRIEPRSKGIQSTKGQKRRPYRMSRPVFQIENKNALVVAGHNFVVNTMIEQMRTRWTHSPEVSVEWNDEQWELSKINP